MAVILADILDARNVTLELQAKRRDEALREIVATMAADERLAARDGFLAEVIAREEVQTTFMGNGVAFPHARTDLVERIILGIGRSSDGVPFSESGARAHLIFVIGVPRRMATDYLVCVGALARITKAEGTRAELATTESAEEFVEILRAGSLLLE